MSRLEAALAELAEAIRDEVRAELTATAAAPDRMLNVDEASTALGQGRSRIYQEISAGRLRSCVAGRRRLIPASAIAEYIAAASPPSNEPVRSLRSFRTGPRAEGTTHAQPIAPEQ